MAWRVVAGLADIRWHVAFLRHIPYNVSQGPAQSSRPSDGRGGQTKAAAFIGTGEDEIREWSADCRSGREAGD